MAVKRRKPRKQSAESGSFADVPSTISGEPPPPSGDLAPEAPAPKRPTPFPIVGIGASAGGLEAFRELLSALPDETGMAFVLVVHLDPTHESRLPELLSRITRRPVFVISEGMRVEREHVYVIPPNVTLTISGGAFVLAPRDSSVPNLPIDRFFDSLAQDQGAGAIGVVLSGAGSDGTLGLKAIRVEGGITFAQDERSAKYSGMPRSALELADFVLPPDEIAKELGRIGRHPFARRPAHDAGAGPPVADEDGVLAVARILRRATGVDFTQYKPGTIRRRLARRMVVTKIDALDEYVRLLRRDPEEVQALYEDMLIQVTAFFRDAESFEQLKQGVFSALIDERGPDDPIRIWVPGCATGEEAYSLVICLLEFLENADARVPIQLFGTDVSPSAIARARVGAFSPGIESEVSPTRLRRFFSRVNGTYQINKSIRDSCVFAPQDLTRDPPFSRLDLISCSNVLIYFNTALQERIIPIFHYALKPNGFLRLGRSEGVGRYAQLFSLIDRKHKIYQRKPGPPMTVGFGLTETDRVPRVPELPAQLIAAGATGWSRAAIERDADRLILGRFAPSGVVVNGEWEIVQFRGKTGAYLETPSGAVHYNLLAMVRDDLQNVLRHALQQAARNGAPVSVDPVEIRTNAGYRRVGVEVLPVGPPHGARGRHYLVLFVEAPEPTHTRRKTKAPEERARSARRGEKLRQDQLEALQYQLATMREEYDAAIEELRAATEEAQSSNEELQSTNEELETAKEELQATNEELTTVNDELASRHAELSQLSNDLLNLLSSVQMPILMVGTDLCVRRMTPASERVLGVVPTDIGRPIGDLRLSAEIPELEWLVRTAIDALTVEERELKGRDGRWYALRVRPYRTSEHKIDGAVISFVDIDALKRGFTQVEEARADAEKATLAKDKFLAILSHELRTPLQAMLGWIRMLRAGKLSDEDVAKALEVIERNTLLQARLINDLLDVSRIVTGRLRLDVRPVLIAPVVEAALTTMRPVAEAQGVTLVTRIDQEAGAVLGESARLQQIVVNLVSNAIKFTPRGGRIDVRVAGRDNQVELSVSDTGRGISREDLPGIFDRFGHSETTRASSAGLGVGLSIVRHLVELHRGSVRAESPGPGHGSSLIVTLPTTNQLPPDEAIPRPVERVIEPMPDLQAVKVLVVEDENDTRQILQAILSGAGAAVTAVPDARTALERLGAARFDVLVSDIMMPGEDGYALIKQVRQMERGGAIPAIALTALASATDRAAATEAGYEEHVPKPVEPVELIAAVARLARPPSTCL